MIFTQNFNFQVFIALIFVRQSFETWSRDSSILTYLKNIAFDREGCPNVLKGRVKTWAKMDKTANFVPSSRSFHLNRFVKGGWGGGAGGRADNFLIYVTLGINSKRINYFEKAFDFFANVDHVRQKK